MDISVTGGATADLRAFLRENRVSLPKAYDIAGGAMQLAVKDQVFKAFDADQDGKVSADEIAKLGNNGQDKLADKQALVSAFDRNGDGALDVGEFGASRLLDRENLQTLLGVQDEKGVAGWLVSRADADGDGALSLDEYAAVASTRVGSGRIGADGKAVWDPVEKVNADRFGWTDADKDGRLSVDELAAKLAAAPEIRRIGDSGQAVGVLSAAADGDGDGGVSARELAAAAKAQDLDTGPVDDLMRAADRDGDAKLSVDELRAAVQAQPRLFKLGAADDPGAPTAGEILLARLLRSTMDSLSDRTASELGGALNRTA